MRAAIYTRFSTNKQREASSEDQARNCRQRIEREGWDLQQHYRDEGISGSISLRPGYQTMLRAAAAREFDVILVDDLSRLSRDQVESERAIRRLEHAGLRLIAVSDGYDSDSKARKVLRAVKGLTNKMYLDDLRDKTHRGLTGRALAKFSAGGLPYGYRSVPVAGEARGEIVGFRREPDSVRAPIVREMFERHAQGESMKAIASSLNARGVPSPGSTWRRRARRTDGRWLVSAVHAMLHNEMYRGRYVWNRSSWVKDPDTGQRLRRERPESEWIAHEMPELAIVEIKTWELVQGRLRTRQDAFGGGRGGHPKYLLSGLLRCERCGSAMVLYGDTPRRYVCGTYRAGGPAACDMKLSARRDVAEEIVLTDLDAELLSEEAVDLAVAEMERAHRMQQDGPADVSPELARLDQEIAELERLVQSGTISHAIAAPSLERAAEQRRKLQTARKRDRSVTRGLFGAEAAYRSTVARVREVLRGEDIAPARTALQRLLGSVPVRPAADGRVLEANLRSGPALLWKAAGTQRDSDGSGGRLRHLSAGVALPKQPLAAPDRHPPAAS